MENNDETTIDNNRLLLMEKKIEARLSQSEASRMVEYITGLSLEDPDLLNRLDVDQQKIRVKYGLPDRELKFVNPSEYEKYLRELAKSNGVTIRYKSDCGRFFTKFLAGGVYLSNERVIGVNIDKSSQKKFSESLVTLEHETIHSLQQKYFPSMPIEIMEYESYVANWNMDLLKQDSERVKTLFGFAVITSVYHWYEEISEEERRKINPVWNDPEYFLKNVDGVGDKAIEKYKVEHPDKKEE